MIAASENLPRLTGLAADAGPKGLEGRGIWARSLLYENRPRRANAGPGTGGGQDRSACLIIRLPGYGQGCSPRIVRLQHKSGQKKCHVGRGFREGFDF